MNAVVQILGKKAMGKLKDKDTNTNAENPYLVRVSETNRKGETTFKDRERPVPEGLSDNDKEILRKVRRKAYKWDMSFRFCCFQTRFGWSFFIGLIPFFGDFADLLMSTYLIKTASKVDGGLPVALYSRMTWNVGVDFLVGLIPFLGDLADAVFRANTRNAWLLDAYLTEKAKALREGTVQDPDSGEQLAVPGELRSADVERGMTQVPASIGVQNGRQPQR